jgi:hypothetical protein
MIPVQMFEGILETKEKDFSGTLQLKAKETNAHMLWRQVLPLHSYGSGEVTVTRSADPKP